MTHAQLSPAPGRAGHLAMTWSQARFETGLLMRNGEQLLLTIIIPLVLLVGLSVTSVLPLGAGDPVDVATPGILALAVLSTAFTAQAIATGFDRRSGALRLLATTPLPRAGLLAGKVLAVLIIETIQVIAISVTAILLGWQPRGGVLPVVIALVLGTAAFTSLAMGVAGVLRAEATLAVANGIFLLLLLAGGTVIPLDRLPAAVAAVAQWLPSNALGVALREILLQGNGIPITSVVVLLVWTAIGVIITARWFRWT